MAIRDTDNVNPATGHVAVAQPSWRGIPRCSARPPALCSYVPQVSSAPPAAHQRWRATPSACRRAGGAPEASCDHHQIRRHGPQPGAARTGCSSLTREDEQGSAGCYQRPCRKMRCVVRSPCRWRFVAQRQARSASAPHCCDPASVPYRPRIIHDGQAAHPRQTRSDFARPGRYAASGETARVMNTIFRPAVDAGVLASSVPSGPGYLSLSFPDLRTMASRS
jgi:hypothetical protein